MPNRSRWFCWIALFSCLAANYATADTLHVIALRHRPAAELQPLIQPLLQPDEGVSASGYQLILRASESRRREIERLVATLDVASRQLTLTLRQTTGHNDQRARDAVNAEINAGNRARVVIGNAPVNRADRDRQTLQYRGERRTSSTDGTRTQIVRVQDGQHAFIRIGQSVYTVERVLALTGRRAVVLANGARLEDFATGFDVLPRVHGNTVQLEIAPRLAGPRHADGTLNFRELRTTVTVRLGEWVDLGVLMGETSEVNRAILENASTQSNERSSISLKVE